MHQLSEDEWEVIATFIDLRDSLALMRVSRFFYELSTRVGLIKHLTLRKRHLSKQQKSTFTLSPHIQRLHSLRICAVHAFAILEAANQINWNSIRRLDLEGVIMSLVEDPKIQQRFGLANGFPWAAIHDLESLSLRRCSFDNVWSLIRNSSNCTLRSLSLCNIEFARPESTTYVFISHVFSALSSVSTDPADQIQLASGVPVSVRDKTFDGVTHLVLSRSRILATNSNIFSALCAMIEHNSVLTHLDISYTMDDIQLPLITALQRNHSLRSLVLDGINLRVKIRSNKYLSDRRLYELAKCFASGRLLSLSMKKCEADCVILGLDKDTSIQRLCLANNRLIGWCLPRYSQLTEVDLSRCRLGRWWSILTARAIKAGELPLHQYRSIKLCNNPFKVGLRRLLRSLLKYLQKQIDSEQQQQQQQRSETSQLPPCIIDLTGCKLHETANSALSLSMKYREHTVSYATLHATKNHLKKRFDIREVLPFMQTDSTNQITPAIPALEYVKTANVFLLIEIENKSAELRSRGGGNKATAVSHGVHIVVGEEERLLAQRYRVNLEASAVQCV